MGRKGTWCYNIGAACDAFCTDTDTNMCTTATCINGACQQVAANESSVCAIAATCKSMVCTCDTGYLPAGGNGTAVDSLGCIDIDECALNSTLCPAANSLCTNLPGNYSCGCKAGYSGNGITSCADINECALTGNASVCVANATCANTPGNYSCTCPAGYSGDGRVNGTGCTDINECAFTGNASVCGANTVCTNTPGSYSCACKAGYQGNPVTGCTGAWCRSCRGLAARWRALPPERASGFGAIHEGACGGARCNRPATHTTPCPSPRLQISTSVPTTGRLPCARRAPPAPTPRATTRARAPLDTAATAGRTAPAAQMLTSAPLRRRPATAASPASTRPAVTRAAARLVTWVTARLLARAAQVGVRSSSRPARWLACAQTEQRIWLMYSAAARKRALLQAKITLCLTAASVYHLQTLTSVWGTTAVWPPPPASTCPGTTPVRAPRASAATGGTALAAPAAQVGRLPQGRVECVSKGRMLASLSLQLYPLHRPASGQLTAHAPAHAPSPPPCRCRHQRVHSSAERVRDQRHVRQHRGQLQLLLPGRIQWRRQDCAPQRHRLYRYQRVRCVSVAVRVGRDVRQHARELHLHLPCGVHRERQGWRQRLHRWAGLRVTWGLVTQWMRAAPAPQHSFPSSLQTASRKPTARLRRSLPQMSTSARSPATRPCARRSPRAPTPPAPTSAPALRVTPVTA